MKRFLGVVILLAAASDIGAQSAPVFLPATPANVAWGYYWSQAKPVLTVHSGDEVRIQTLSTCGPNERLIAEGVPPANIPVYNDAIYKEVRSLVVRRDWNFVGNAAGTHLGWFILAEVSAWRSSCCYRARHGPIQPSGRRTPREDRHRSKATPTHLRSVESCVSKVPVPSDE